MISLAPTLKVIHLLLPGSPFCVVCKTLVAEPHGWVNEEGIYKALPASFVACRKALRPDLLEKARLGSPAPTVVSEPVDATTNIGDVINLEFHRKLIQIVAVSDGEEHSTEVYGVSDDGLFWRLEHGGWQLQKHQLPSAPLEELI